MLTTIIVMLATSLLLLLIFSWLPVMGRTKALFGVRMTDEAFQATGRPAVRRYRLSLAAIYIGINLAGALLATWRANFFFSLGAYLLSVFGGVLLYSSYVRQMWPLRVNTSGTRFATSLSTRRLADHTVPVLEIAIVVLTVAPLVALAVAYPSLPARMPVHWNGFGQPDRWANKSFAVVFFIPLMAAYLQAWLIVLKRDLIQAKLTIPAEKAQTYLRYKEQGLQLFSRMMDWSRGAVAYLLAGISLLVLASSDQYRPLLPVISISIWCASAVLLGGTGYLLLKMIKLNKELEILTGNAVVQRESEAEGWKSGLFYYNRNDPAVLVEKLSGMGYTLNFGNRRVFIHLAFLLGVLALAAWALTSL